MADIIGFGDVRCLDSLFTGDGGFRLTVSALDGFGSHNMVRGTPRKSGTSR